MIDKISNLASPYLISFLLNKINDSSNNILIHEKDKYAQIEIILTNYLKMHDIIQNEHCIRIKQYCLVINFVSGIIKEYAIGIIEASFHFGFLQHVNNFI